MKKILTLILAALLLIISIAPAGAIDKYSLYCTTMTLTVGSKVAKINGATYYSPVAPFIKSGRVFVPLRFVAEQLEADVIWDNFNKQINVMGKDDVCLQFTVGDKRLYYTDRYSSDNIDWTLVNMDVPPIIKNGNTFVALRYVFEPMAASVNYDAKSKTVTVKKVDTTGWRTYTEPYTGTTIKYPGRWGEKMRPVTGEDEDSDYIDLWHVETEGLYLEIYNGGTTFMFSYEDKPQRDVIMYNREYYLKQGWKVVKETGTYVKFTKNNSYTELIKIISTRPKGVGSLVFTVDTNAYASEWDMIICDKMTPGPGI